jgi:3-hydroxyisobutyrate dehydrogenase-like beta-hydroxyacid dehydrogenase
MRVGFVGLGVMGSSMAGHLLAGGHELTVYNRTVSRTQALVDAGARRAATPGEAARNAEAVFVCVRDTPDVVEVCLGVGGIAETAGRGTVVVDHSTISPKTARELAHEFAARGVEFLDAPVSGGDIGARNATLSIMVGGAEGALRRVEPLLRCMGKTIVHTGQPGSGQMTKLVNQVLVSLNNLAVCEALTLAKKNGLDAQKTLEAVSGGAAGSWQLSNMAPRMLKGDFKPGFSIDLQQKDLRLVLEAAEQSQVSLLGTALVHQLFSAAQSGGGGGEGTQALLKVIEGLANTH